MRLDSRLCTDKSHILLSTRAVGRVGNGVSESERRKAVHQHEQLGQKDSAVSIPGLVYLPSWSTDRPGLRSMIVDLHFSRTRSSGESIDLEVVPTAVAHYYWWLDVRLRAWQLVPKRSFGESCPQATCNAIKDKELLPRFDRKEVVSLCRR
jgi:hypothetical protein